MRKIKFRGSRIKNGDLVYGDLLHKGNKTYIAVNHGVKMRVKPCTVKQLVGIDSNGNELYEDDIVNVTTPEGHVWLPIICFLHPTLIDLILAQSGYSVTKKG